ncbi:MAG: 4-hydroxy-3-methylbut-2-enyl diphosphate reductase, partial [Nitrospinota bacterium]
MQIKVAKTACFCMGVKRAMDMVLDASGPERKPVLTYGPLIHNPQVLQMLRSRNINIIENLEEGDPGSHIVIRTHGVSPETRKKIKEKSFKVSDATCPLVARVQGTVKRYAKQGYSTVIVGDEGHAEIIGLMGFTEGKGVVIKSPDQVNTLPPMERVCVVGQTT